jgi:hypothetical protein
MNKLDELKMKMQFAQQHGNLETFYELEEEYLKEVKKCKKKK